MAAVCANCSHFCGSPREVEAQLKGMRTLGSAYGSVRATDGICNLRDRYLDPSSTCPSYEPAAAVTFRFTPGRAQPLS
jgi:hypothetical protein